MRVTMLSSYPPMHCGIGDHVSEFAPYLARAGAGIDLLTYDEAAPLGPSVPGIKVRPVLSRRSSPWKVARQIQEAPSKPDVLAWQSQMFIHPRPFNLAPLLLPRQLPLVTFVHDTPNSARLLHTTPFLRPLYRRSDILITHSRVTAGILTDRHGVDARKVHQLPLGVDLRQFHPGRRSAELRQRLGWGPDDVVVLFLGFINEGKGVFELLEGYASARPSAPRLRLVIAGEDVAPASGGRRLGIVDALRRRARELDVSLDLPGFVASEDFGAWLSSADVVALPYRFIYQSAVLSKAMGSGACILASNVDGFAQWVREGESALLVPPRDAAAISRALVRLGNDAALRESLRRGAAAEAERAHDMERLAKETLGLLEEAINERSARG